MTAIRIEQDGVLPLVKFVPRFREHNGWQLTYRISPVGKLRLKPGRVHYEGLIKNFPDIEVVMTLISNDPSNRRERLIVDFRSKRNWPIEIYKKWFEENIQTIVKDHPDEFGDRVDELLMPDPNRRPRLH